MNKSKERWVVKAGSSLLAGKEEGINQAFVSSLTDQVNTLIQNGVEVIIVSSGAVARGMHELNLKKRPNSINLLQASAAVGQLGLINSYRKEFSKFGIKTAQVLISHDDIANRERYLNARNSLNTLLELGVVPIINENDSVSTEEISFGDNDTLAGAITGLTDADKFIMLTDQEGVFSQNPKNNSEAKLLTSIDLDDQFLDIERIAQSPAGELGRGGMKTKFEAASLSLNSGAKTWVVDGNYPKILNRIFAGHKVGTFFKGKRDKLQSRKKWIASLGKPSGKIFIDDGAAKAITKTGSSLLPVGVFKVLGKFKKGSLVECLNNKKVVAKGLSNFNSEELNLLLGIRSEEISSILGYTSEDEVIHRDNLLVS